MLAIVFFHILGLIQGLPGQMSGTSGSGGVGQYAHTADVQLIVPVLTGAQILIPLAIAISAINRLMDHRESAGTFFIEMVTKGGGAILLIQLMKTMAGA